MNLKEAAGLLGWKREDVEAAIVKGVETPLTKINVKLVAEKLGSDFDIPDEELDRLLLIFEKEEPGRNPPIAVRRKLLVECGYQCAICESDAPLRFHHILDWAKLKHHDPKHMLAVCGSCHDKIGTGQIDTKSQQAFKAKLADASIRLARLEEAVVKNLPREANDWSKAAHDYILRNVEFVVIYKPFGDKEQEYFQPIANGCLVDENHVLTCSEALENLQRVTEHKKGAAVILHGHARLYFEVEEVDKATGLCLCKIVGKDENIYQEVMQTIRAAADARNIDAKTIEGYWFFPVPTKSVEWTITPWLGQEVGFIIASDCKDSLRQGEISRVEFGASVISYFKLPTDRGLKVFVSAVFPGTVRQVGSAVFSRNSTLLGIICGVEQNEFDASYRITVKSLLGFPRFTQAKLKKSGQEG